MRRRTNLEDIGNGDGVLGGLALGGDDGDGWPRHGGCCGLTWWLVVAMEEVVVNLEVHGRKRISSGRAKPDSALALCALAALASPQLETGQHDAIMQSAAPDWQLSDVLCYLEQLAIMRVVYLGMQSFSKHAAQLYPRPTSSLAMST